MNRWTSEQVEILKAVAARGGTMLEAAEELGKSRSAIESKARSIRVKFGRQPQTPIIRNKGAAGGAAVGWPPAPAVHRSRTARLFGDPPIGRSALDQKMGAA